MQISHEVSQNITSAHSNSLADACLLSKKATPEGIQATCIMAVYAGDKTPKVRRAINSILQQTLPPQLFVIVIDGYVDDEIMNLLKQFDQSEANIFLIQQYENLGLSHGLNLAIEWAQQFSPAFYFRMDADDEALPARFERQMEYFTRLPDVDVLGTGMIELSSDGNQVERIPPADGSVIVEALSRRSYLYHPTVAFRGHVFSRGYKYPTEFPYVEDLRFWAVLAKAGFHFANVPEALLKFSVDDNFYRRRGLQRNFAELRARFYVMRELAQFGPINTLFALAVFAVRLLPSRLLRRAYVFDRKKAGRQ